jgi:hypothetical protein
MSFENLEIAILLEIKKQYSEWLKINWPRPRWVSRPVMNG